MNKFEQIEQDKKKKSKGQKGVFKLYILPIVALGAFLSIIFFLVIPKIGSVIEKVGEINSLSDEFDQDLKELSNLQVLSNQSTILEENLNIINSIAPAGQTEVVNFQQKLSDISQGYNLEITNQVFNDNKVNDTDLQLGALVLRQIPTRFEVSGFKEDILGFLTEINNLDDFIVIQEMELNSQGLNSGNNTGVWNLSLIMVKYQFSQQDITKLNEQFLQVPSTAKPSKIVVDYVENRKKLLSTEEESTTTSDSEEDISE